MFDERVRRALPPLIDPMARALAGVGVSANMVTAATFVAGTAAAALIAVGFPRAGLAVWLVSRFGDAIDGALARVEGRPSAIGGYLDITLDMAAYSLMVIGFAAARPDLGVAWSAVLAGYVLAITTTLALSNAAASKGRTVSTTNRTFQFTTGLAEAGETSVMYTAWVIFPGWLPWLVWMWVAVLALTAVQRSRLAWRVLR